MPCCVCVCGHCWGVICRLKSHGRGRGGDQPEKVSNITSPGRRQSQHNRLFLHLPSHNNHPCAVVIITRVQYQLGAGRRCPVLTITAWNGNQTFNWAAKNMVVINRDKFLSLKMLLGNISIKNIWFIFGSPSLSDQMDHGQQGQGKLELIVAVQFKIS